MLRHAADAFGVRWRTLCEIGIVLASMAAGALTAQADPARVAVTAYVREGPGTDYRPVDEAPAGQEADLIGCRDGWCRIRLGDLDGYVPQAVLSTPAPDAENATRFCFDNEQAGYHGFRELRLCYASPAGPFK